MKQESIRTDGTRQHLIALVAKRLSAVTFVQDYIQLQFDGPVINAYTLPSTYVGASIVSESDSGYRDALCSRIGATVVAAYAEPGDRLQIDFDDGSTISISLKPEHRIVAEAAVYSDAQTGEWASW
jgi:hypothetical protein